MYNIDDIKHVGNWYNMNIGRLEGGLRGGC